MPRMLDSATTTTPSRRLPLPLRQARLESLCAHVQGCRCCPAMEGRRRVLSEQNGRAGVPVMFIGEAPGRLGAEQTGVPFCGDAAGVNFELLLEAAGWAREDVYVTNAVLCNPQDDGGRNRPPSRLELELCSHNLEATLALVDPLIVATLGANALAALSLIHPHRVVLGRGLATPHAWAGRILFPLYHTSPRVLSTRDMGQQAGDFRRLRSLVESLQAGKLPDWTPYRDNK